MKHQTGLFSDNFEALELPEPSILEHPKLLEFRITDILNSADSREHAIRMLVAYIRAREAETSVYSS